MECLRVCLQQYKFTSYWFVLNTYKQVYKGGGLEASQSVFCRSDGKFSGIGLNNERDNFMILGNDHVALHKSKIDANMGDHRDTYVWAMSSNEWCAVEEEPERTGEGSCIVCNEMYIYSKRISLSSRVMILIAYLTPWGQDSLSML